MEYVFTSESVSEGHPDKMADQISDVILDALISQDKYCRVACEVFVKNNFVLLGGEISTTSKIDYKSLTLKTIENIGYDSKHFEIMNVIGEQSTDIAMGVDRESPENQGAGDQGIMFGFACKETPELMPAPIQFAHQIVRLQAKLRKDRTISWLKPDAKSQVTVRYKDHQPIAIDAVVLSTQHDEKVSTEEIINTAKEKIIHAALPKELLHADTKYFINPTGRFVIGGPESDCGVTGRKLIVDTYGGMAHHGGGSFSGKDPSKVDRSATYACRYIAKNVVAAGLAERCELQVSYAIGIAEPVSIFIDTFGTETIAKDQILKKINKVFDLRPYHIIRNLNLLTPHYASTAAYGHFGREDLGFAWEKTDKIKDLQNA